MTGHTDKGGRTQPGQIQRQHTGRLGGIHDQRNALLDAQSVVLLQGRKAAKHVGNMVDNDTAGVGPQGLGHAHAGSRSVKQRPAGHGIGDPFFRQMLQGPHHRIVLIAGDDGVAAPVQKALNGDVQAVGGIHGEHHPFGVLQVKKLRRRFPAVIDHPGGVHGRPVPGTAGIGAFGHGPGHGLADGRGLLQGGGGSIQIDHGDTSRQTPFCWV